MKLAVLLVAGLALAGCNRGGIENKQAVRQAVIDHLASRTNLNLSSMNVEVTSVTFKGDEADANVSFAPRGGSAADGMNMRYALERQGNRWVVKSRADNGMDAHGMGGDPHGAMPGAHPMPEMPGMPRSPGAASPSGELPRDHPPVPGSGKK